MDKTLTDLRISDPFKIIITLYRKKEPGDYIKIPRIGSNLFVGSDIYALRNYGISQAKALIVIGGDEKTREEILMARERKIPVIPVAMSGGTALTVWDHYLRSEHNLNQTAFS